MKVLLIGTGGREHALAWKIASSPYCTRLFVAKGNGGTAEWNVPLIPDQPSSVLAFCKSETIDLVVIGPEQPLSEGLADTLREAGILVVGPGKAGARLESSKVFSKAFMEKYHIPTAKAQYFLREDYDEALLFLMQQPLPVVIKVDGLAAGKGVIIANNHDEAIKALDDIFHEDSFGPAGDKILVESFLTGKEVSVFILTDGKNWILLPEAMDYKRAREGNLGPNTGGMGAISPVPFFTQSLKNWVSENIIEPTLKGLREENIEYRGFIFFGLMTDGEEARVIEYNVRMGDPETEAVIPRIVSDILPLLKDAASGNLSAPALEISPRAAATTVCVSGGYPGVFEKDFPIQLYGKQQDILYFHAGTRMSDNQLLTSGGRVMAVTGLGDTLEDAVKQSQEGADAVQFEKKYFRPDIGTIY
jgi:phosphoribosylamine--glycine ligase